MKRLRHHHPLAIRWFHWLNFPLLSLMIWSGLLIYWANDIYRVGWGDRNLVHFFPDRFYDTLRLPHRLADGMAWHFAVAWLFVLNGVLYVVYTALSGQWRYIVPNRRSFGEAIQVVLHDLRIRKLAPPIGKYNGAQQIAYTGVVVMAAGSVLTGLAIYKPTQLSWLTTSCGGYEWARWEHFWLTVGFVLFFVIHVEEVIRAGWNNFRGMVSGYQIVPEEKEASATVIGGGDVINTGR